MLNVESRIGGIHALRVFSSPLCAIIVIQKHKKNSEDAIFWRVWERLFSE